MIVSSSSLAHSELALLYTTRSASCNVWVLLWRIECFKSRIRSDARGCMSRFAQGYNELKTIEISTESRAVPQRWLHNYVRLLILSACAEWLITVVTNTASFPWHWNDCLNSVASGEAQLQGKRGNHAKRLDRDFASWLFSLPRSSSKPVLTSSKDVIFDNMLLVPRCCLLPSMGV